MFGGVNFSEEQAGITYDPPCSTLRRLGAGCKGSLWIPLFFVGLRALRHLIYHTQMYVIPPTPEQPSVAVKSQISEAGQIEVRAPSAILPDR